ncbi:MAG: hypothetical protein QOG62_2060 [Thermoleophilaceae bacterium]|nr:hypothetical protein [Thermoleophilaceae bacterium]
MINGSSRQLSTGVSMRELSQWEFLLSALGPDHRAMRPRWTEPLVALLAPPLCVSCGAHAGPAEPFCRACRVGLAWLDQCQAPVAGVPAWAPVAYAGPARALVGSLKFRGARPAAAAMASQIAAAVPADWLQGMALVPVPLHPARLRSRGYNQAALIAQQLSVASGLAVADCLVRDGPATTQVGRDRTRRATGIFGRVHVRRGTTVPPAVLLVDDVITTGATVAACSDALRSAGCFHVRALSYARTPGR